MQTVAVHFNSPGHNGIDDLRIQLVDAAEKSSELDAKESSWIWNLGSHQISGGFNDREPYLNVTLNN